MKSFESDRIKNYWLKAFPADQRHIRRKRMY